MCARTPFVSHNLCMFTKTKQIPLQSECLRVLAWLAHNIGNKTKYCGFFKWHLREWPNQTTQSVLYKREIFEIYKHLQKPHSCTHNAVLSKLTIKCAENYFKENWNVRNSVRPEKDYCKALNGAQSFRLHWGFLLYFFFGGLDFSNSWWNICRSTGCLIASAWFWNNKQFG